MRSIHQYLRVWDAAHLAHYGRRFDVDFNNKSMWKIGNWGNPNRYVSPMLILFNFSISIGQFCITTIMLWLWYDAEELNSLKLLLFSKNYLFQKCDFLKLARSQFHLDDRYWLFDGKKCLHDLRTKGRYFYNKRDTDSVELTLYVIEFLATLLN